MRSFQRCRRQWYLQYYRMLSYPEGDNRPVTVGILVHKAMEAFYDPNPEADHDPLNIMNQLLEEMVTANKFYEAEIRSAGELATVMFEGYCRWVEETYADVGLEIVSAEGRISAPLGDTGLLLTGRPDARAMRMGQKVPIDHKTVDSLDEIPKTAQIDSQFKTYHLIEFLNDKETPIDAVMVNMFRRVNHNHANSKPPYFQRYEVRYNIEEIRNHWRHVLEIGKQIAAVRERLGNGENHHTAVPPSPQKSCSWDCSFRSICSMMNDGSNFEHVIKTQYIEGGV